jgi:Aspartyl/asparaginyl-tRNA synthetases
MQEGVVRGFRDYLFKEGFTEIRTPKIVATGAEGGANIFKLDYFGKKAFLAQSPQFYKQMLVGVYERVFEVAPVFRAEKHNTTRHLNEYIGLDFEMGFISDFREIMEMETGAIKNMIELLKSEYERELKILNLELPEVTEIPTVRFKDAKEMVATEYGRKIKDPYDLEPEEEQLISKLFKEKYNSDFVFVTHYPVKKRPFYAMDDPSDPKYTLSFDLLFRGMEITTGGQRIHNYDDQVAKMISKGLDPADFEGYLMIHKYGMPPHGGLGMGLERLCMKLLDESNVRVASMFPRDMSRLTP